MKQLWYELFPFAIRPASFQERIADLKMAKVALKNDIVKETLETNKAITALCKRVAELSTLQGDANEI